MPRRTVSWNGIRLIMSGRCTAPHPERRARAQRMRERLKRDKAKTHILPISSLGLMEMTRQRAQESLSDALYQNCPYCSGRGVVKTSESMAIEVIRILMLFGQLPHVAHISVKVNDQVASYLNNRKRRELSELEEEGKMSVQVLGSEEALPEYLELDCRDQRGNPVRIEGT